MTMSPQSFIRWEPVGSLSRNHSRLVGTRAARINLTLMKIIALLSALALASCVTTETTAPDGTVTRIKAPAPGSLELIGKGIEVIGSK